jgi:hypothetical protein
MRLTSYSIIAFRPCSTLAYSPPAGFPGLYFTPRLAPPLVLTVDLRFIIFILFQLVSWDSAVGTATGYRLDGQGFGVRVPVEQDSSLYTSSHRSWGPPCQWVPGVPGV